MAAAVLTAFPARIQNRIDEKPMKAELIWRIGSDEKNEDFYKPKSFAVDSQGRFFILDSGNSRVQCFSPEGKFLFSFGRAGQGPGELSKEAERIRILEDGNIYIIDNRQRRINIYNMNGKFLFSRKTEGAFNDILLIDGWYYLSNLILNKNHLPIHVTKTLEKIDHSFGIFIDPDIDLAERLLQLNKPGLFESSFNSAGGTHLLVNKKKEIIYSQVFPYRLIKYNTEGRILCDIEPDTGFGTGSRTVVSIDKDKDQASIGFKTPPARLFQPYLMDDDHLAYFYFSPEKDTAFLDLYDRDLKLISRHKMPNQFVDFRLEDYRPKEYLGEVFIDRNNNLYALSHSQEDPPRLVKYKLIY